MPYSSNSELPKAVRQTVPEDKHTQFRTVFNRVYEDTDSEQEAFRAAWSAVEKSEDEVDKSVMDTLRDKAEEFNEKYGDNHGRVSASKLKQVYDRGIGAYKTNPNSVRPNVKSKEQWAYARVNSFLDIVRGEKSPKHDKDLLPKEKMLKAQYANDIFTTEMEARARSMDLGLNGAVHVHEYDGQAVYMPGSSHEGYLDAYRTEDEEPDDIRMEALRCVVREILEKHDTEIAQKKEYKLPESARNNARQVLEWKDKYGDEVKGMTSTGWRRARQLAENESVGADTVRRMASFNRHRKNSKVDPKHKDEPWKDAGYVAWLGWGGDTGIDWAIETSDSMEKADFESYGQVTKMDDEQRIVYGYASVISKNGEPIVDRQGDIITAEELEKAASDFMLGERNGLTMHKGEPTTTIIHSFPMTNETKKAYQIESPYEAWLIAVKVHDDATWERVKQGQLKDFSIGGSATRRDV